VLIAAIAIIAVIVVVIPFQTMHESVRPSDVCVLTDD
jgi:hypothetical protein